MRVAPVGPPPPEQRLPELLESAHAQVVAALIGAERPALGQVMTVIVDHARRLVDARWARLELCTDDLPLHPSAAESMEESSRA